MSRDVQQRLLVRKMSGDASHREQAARSDVRKNAASEITTLRTNDFQNGEVYVKKKVSVREHVRARRRCAPGSPLRCLRAFSLLCALHTSTRVQSTLDAHAARVRRHTRVRCRTRVRPATLVLSKCMMMACSRHRRRRSQRRPRLFFFCGRSACYRSPPTTLRTNDFQNGEVYRCNRRKSQKYR